MIETGGVRHCANPVRVAAATATKPTCALCEWSPEVARPGDDLQEVLSITVVHGSGEPLHLFAGDEPFQEGDLLDAGDFESLALLDRFHEVGGFEKRLVGSGIEPGEAAAQHLDVELD